MNEIEVILKKYTILQTQIDVYVRFEFKYFLSNQFNERLFFTKFQEIS